MALLARLNGLLEPLRTYATTKPIWGTCAGAILLASGGVEGTKKGGQEVIGGVDVKILRNGWGSQVLVLLPLNMNRRQTHLAPQLESFEAELEVDGLRESSVPFKGVFIRAPVRSHCTLLACIYNICLGRSPVDRNTCVWAENRGPCAYFPFPRACLIYPSWRRRRY